MSGNIDTSYIDNKKNKSQPSSTNITQNYINFVFSLVKIVVMILVTILFGSSILYAGKVATANVLPTDEFCTPYTKFDANVTPIDVDINVNKIDGNFYSTKINFPYNKSDDKSINKMADYNKSNIILDWLTKQKDVYNSWGVKMYFINVLEGLFLKNYSIVNSVLFFMNKYFYELLIILFGPWFLLFLIPLVTIYNFFYSIYLWVIEFKWLFKENINNKEGQKPKWEDVTFMNAFNFCISCIMSFWIIVILCVLYFLTPLTALSSFIFAICLFGAMMMKSMISDGENMYQPYGILKTFSDMLFSKMHYIMMILSILMILLSFSYLGGVSGVFAIIACIILFVGLIGNKIYNKQIPKDSTPGLVSEEVEQALRTCTKLQENVHKSGLLSNIFGQAGGDGEKLLSKLKKLSKTM